MTHGPIALFRMDAKGVTALERLAKATGSEDMAQLIFEMANTYQHAIDMAPQGYQLALVKQDFSEVDIQSISSKGLDEIRRQNNIRPLGQVNEGGKPN